MKQRFSILSFVLAIFLLLPASMSVAASADEVALSFIEKYGIGNNLAALSYQIASNTQTYKIISNKVGELKAQELVKSEINKLVPSYQNQWNKILSSSYAEVFSLEKLQSLLDEGPASKYSGEVKEKQKEIGSLVHVKSKDLLNELLTKALGSALSKLPPE